MQEKNLMKIWPAFLGKTRIYCQIFMSRPIQVSIAGYRVRAIAGFYILAVSLSCWATLPIYGQMQYRELGAVDTEIPAPRDLSNISALQPTALAEITAYTQTTGDASWTTMRATGTLKYDDDPALFQAKLSIAGYRKYRLDVQAAEGEESTVIRNDYGVVIKKGVVQQVLLPEDAGAGLVQFSIPRMANFTSLVSSISDMGLMQINGVQLHRISVVLPAKHTSQPRPNRRANVLIDFYFDPSTHLLAKSAMQIGVQNAKTNKYIRVVSYADYRTVNGQMIPFEYKESLGGHHIWTLQLNDVSVGVTLAPSAFDTGSSR